MSSIPLKFKILQIIGVIFFTHNTYGRQLRSRAKRDRSDNTESYRCAPSDVFANNMSDEQCSDASKFCFDSELNEPVYCSDSGMRCRKSNCDFAARLIQPYSGMPLPTDSYRCVSSDDDVNNFDCSSTTIDCTNSDGTGADITKCGRLRCQKVTCDGSSAELMAASEYLGSVEDYRSKGYEELDYMPYMCVSKSSAATFDCHTAKMCHDDADKTKPNHERCTHPSTEDCKPMNQCINYNLTNKKLSIVAISPGLFPTEQINEGHDPIVFSPWKCIVSSDTPSKDSCGSYPDCYDNTQPKSKDSRKCPLGTSCVLLDQVCPSRVMHKEQNQSHYGDGFHHWGPNVRHGNGGVFTGELP